MTHSCTKKIVKAILADATDRRGWRQEWDQFDDEVRKEIHRDWAKIIDDILAKQRNWGK